MRFNLSVTLDFTLDSCSSDIEIIQSKIAGALEESVRDIQQFSDLQSGLARESRIDLEAVAAESKPVGLDALITKQLGSGKIASCEQSVIFFRSESGALTYIKLGSKAEFDEAERRIEPYQIEDFADPTPNLIAAMRLADKELGTDTSSIQETWLKTDPQMHIDVHHLESLPIYLSPASEYIDEWLCQISYTYDEPMLGFEADLAIPF